MACLCAAIKICVKAELSYFTGKEMYQCIYSCLLIAALTCDRQHAIPGIERHHTHDTLGVKGTMVIPYHQ